MDEHILEAMGKSKIVVKKGQVVEVGEPLIKYCPLFHKYRGIEELDKKSIKENIEFRISDFGMCTPHRDVKMKDFLSFGISETLSTLLLHHIIDCAVMVCEGAGTVIITNPEVCQGVGGRISGIISTSPIKEIITTLGYDNVMDPENAAINQIKGVEKAIKMGYNSIAVTVASSEDAANLRKQESETEGGAIYIFAVHVTGLDDREAQKMFDHADVITACASKTVREIAEKKAIFQAGLSIPIYASTEKGKEFLLKRIEDIGGLKQKKNFKIPDPLI
ncbi:MAG: DUF2099 family protein [Euryarchaeota archaeon]|nr:DUF2099 family protein [Euryarchaeota archaeon]MBV1729350.1 DUF2099 family protein [Methanobacterium sp.]MBU4547611.1 DUF2099 family protein [Euryarchaeota archaeon]MBU4606922.1 DUF2099 family protein [Euryarchaeota archaeon]MBV1754988.1 DUF2099 family protein [Methanobacterium sp.]